MAIFRGPYFKTVDIPLNGGDCEGPRPASAQPMPPGITVQQIVGDRNVAPASGTSVTPTERLADRLMTLRDLYNRKLISQEIYDAEMRKALSEAGE